jgi:ankyrin repeat protein
MAAAGKQKAIVEFLRNYIKKNNIQIDHEDHLRALLAAHGSAEITEVLIHEVKTEKDLEFTDPGTNTALMLACEKGEFDVVKMFLDKKLEFMAEVTVFVSYSSGV